VKFYGMIGHVPGIISRLDFGGNLDLDPGMFRRNFTIELLAVVKTRHYGFSNSPIICKLADLKLNSLN